MAHGRLFSTFGPVPVFGWGWLVELFLHPLINRQQLEQHGHDSPSPDRVLVGAESHEGEAGGAVHGPHSAANPEVRA